MIMNLKCVVFISIFISSFACIAETSFDFFGNEVSIPANCLYIVEKEVFQCDSDEGSLQRIFFEKSDEFLTRMDQFIKDKDKIEAEALEKGEDVTMSTFKTKKFNSTTHYLRILIALGQEVHAYSICNQDSCISLLSEDVNFVQNTISQITYRSLYH